MSLPFIRTVANSPLHRVVLQSSISKGLWPAQFRRNPLVCQLLSPTSALLRAQIEVPTSFSTASFSSATTDRPSSTAGSVSSGSKGIRGWMKERQDRQEKDRYMEQMERLSNMEVFTMENYREELQRGVSGFMANISFLQTKEVKMAKEVVALVEKIIDILGPKATAEDLIAMDRFQRLQLATASNKTLEEISIMVSQITNMDVMQKALRKRKLEGKPIPPDQAAMQAVVRKDAIEVMSKSQKDLLRSRQEAVAKRMARRRR